MCGQSTSVGFSFQIHYWEIQIQESDGQAHDLDIRNAGIMSSPHQNRHDVEQKQMRKGTPIQARPPVTNEIHVYMSKYMYICMCIYV